MVKQLVLDLKSVFTAENKTEGTVILTPCLMTYNTPKRSKPFSESEFVK
jgi:hypothetical protein